MADVFGEDEGRCPLILLSGMGADERVFLPQLASLPNVVVPKWIEPEPRETLAGYGARMAERVDPGRPCFIGGASFGGMLAIEMAHHLDAKCCFLIGSAGSPEQFPKWMRSVRKIPGIAHLIPFKAMARLSKAFALTCGNGLSPAARGFLLQFADADPHFLKWASSAVLRWTPPRPLNIPIYRIHGAKDRILCRRASRDAEILPDGGHVISLSHGPAVNQFLREKMKLHCR